MKLKKMGGWSDGCDPRIEAIVKLKFEGVIAWWAW